MTDGLEGVIATDTVLSLSDARTARLWIRGRPLREAVDTLGYEGTVAALWEGFAGDGLTRDRVMAALGAGRERAHGRLATWLPHAATQPAMEATRLCLAAIPDASSPAEIASALAVGVAAIVRRQRGGAPVAPDPALTTAADFLRMAQGEPAPPAAVRALETYLTVTVENGLSSSTFAGRVAASTQASLVSSVLSAYCAFTGPLHGGAPTYVLDMIDEAEASGDVDSWLERKLAAGARLVGFGNRAFPYGDPRADLLGEAVHHMAADSARVRFAAAFEAKAVAALARHRPGRTLRANLELNAALLLEACGIPRAAFTPVFATGRVPGWLAHALEQQATGRMIRPAARYVGPAVG